MWLGWLSGSGRGGFRFVADVAGVMGLEGLASGFTTVVGLEGGGLEAVGVKVISPDELGGWMVVNGLGGGVLTLSAVPFVLPTC